MYFDDGRSDIECRLPFYKEIPILDDCESENQDVFKYQFIFARLNNRNDYIIRMVFYGNFTVVIISVLDMKPGERKWFR